MEFDTEYKIYKVERGFKIAKQVGQLEWHGYLSVGLQRSRGVSYTHATTLARLDTHAYNTPMFCRAILGKINKPQKTYTQQT